MPRHLRDKIKGIRTITSKTLGVPKSPDGEPLCKWCLSIVEAPRRSWCSNHCVEQFNQLLDCPKKIFFKYEGKCSVCRVDVVKLQKQLDEIWDLYYRSESLRDKLEKSKDWEIEYQCQGKEYWQTKKDDVNLYNTMLENLNQLGNLHPHWLRKLKNGLYRPKRYKAYEIDHVIPISEGGATVTDNLRLMCTKCHHATSAELAERRRKRDV